MGEEGKDEEGETGEERRGEEKVRKGREGERISQVRF